MMDAAAVLSVVALPMPRARLVVTLAEGIDKRVDTFEAATERMLPNSHSR
jgi:hypothetical protein